MRKVVFLCLACLALGAVGALLYLQRQPKLMGVPVTASEPVLGLGQGMVAPTIITWVGGRRETDAERVMLIGGFEKTYVFPPRWNEGVGKILDTINLSRDPVWLYRMRDGKFILSHSPKGSHRTWVYEVPRATRISTVSLGETRTSVPR